MIFIACLSYLFSYTFCGPFVLLFSLQLTFLYCVVLAITLLHGSLSPPPSILRKLSFPPFSRASGLLTCVFLPRTIFSAIFLHQECHCVSHHCHHSTSCYSKQLSAFLFVVLDIVHCRNVCRSRRPY